jgi:hypothetical protein
MINLSQANAIRPKDQLAADSVTDADSFMVDGPAGVRAFPFPALKNQLLGQLSGALSYLGAIDGDSLPASVTTGGFYLVRRGGNSQGKDWESGDTAVWNGNAWDRVPALMDGTINVKRFGAKGDGVADDTTAIQAAATYAGTLASGAYPYKKRPTLYFPDGEYKTTATITIPGFVNVKMAGSLSYYGAANTGALVVGAAGAFNARGEYSFRVNRLSNYALWTDEDLDCGVKMYGTQDAQITLDSITGFTVGLKASGSGQGWVYNNVFIGALVDNKFAIDLESVSFAAAIGWANENKFFGGHFSCTSASPANVSRYGVRIHSKDGTYIANNQNHFWSPSFELSSTRAGTGECVPVWVKNGVGNYVYGARTEGNGTTFARFDNTSYGNVATIGYGDGVQTFTGTSVRNNYVYGADEEGMMAKYATSIFHSGPLHKRAYSLGSAVGVQGAHFIGQGTASVIAKTISSVTISSDYLELSGGRGVGVWVDTTQAKLFMVARDTAIGFGGRVIVTTHDAAGNRIVDADAVKGAQFFSTNQWGGGAAGGGSWSSSTDRANVEIFRVSDAVKKICIYIANGTANLRLRAFSIHSLEGKYAAVWSDGDDYVATFTTLTDGATITLTANGTRVAQNAKVTLGGNRALAFSGVTDGMGGTLVVIQDATGGRTLTLPAGSKVENGGGGAIALTAAPNAVDILSWVCVGTTYYWSIKKNFT